MTAFQAPISVQGAPSAMQARITTSVALHPPAPKTCTAPQITAPSEARFRPATNARRRVSTPARCNPAGVVIGAPSRCGRPVAMSVMLVPCMRGAGRVLSAFPQR